MSFVVQNLSLCDLQSVSWSGSPTHLQYVAAAIERVSRGEVDYLVIDVHGVPFGIDGVDYAVNVGVGTLFQLSIHSNYQSQGIGTALIRALEKRTLDRARSSYEHLGYKIIGTKTESWNEEADNGETTLYTCECLHMRKMLQ